MSAVADDRSEYNHRAAERYLSLFNSLDRNADGVVMRLEAHGDINFPPRFDAMEINMDGVVTTAELQRHLLQNSGVQLNAGRPQ